MSEKIQEPNIFKQKNNIQSRFLDYSDTEIDSRSVAILKSKIISPIQNNIIANKKKQANELFFVTELNNILQHKSQAKFDKCTNQNIFSKLADKTNSPLNSFKNKSVSMDQENLYSFNEFDKFKDFDKLTGQYSNKFFNSSKNQINKEQYRITKHEISNQMIQNFNNVSQVNLKCSQKVLKIENKYAEKQTFFLKRFNIIAQKQRKLTCVRNPIVITKIYKIKKINQQLKNSQQQKIIQKGCNCKNTNCLKLYCECFQNKGFCNDQCKCINCKNTHSFSQLRNQIIQKKEQKNKLAFANKLLKKQIKNGGAMDKLKYMCKCKKTKCVKKYCECFNAGVKCGIECNCTNCQNQINQKILNKKKNFT